MVKFSVLPIASKRAQHMQAAKLCIARELCTITIVIANHGKSL